MAQPARPLSSAISGSTRTRPTATFRGPLETPLAKPNPKITTRDVGTKPRSNEMPLTTPLTSRSLHGVSDAKTKPTLSTTTTTRKATAPATVVPSTAAPKTNPTALAKKTDVRGYSELKKSEETLKETVDRLNQTINKQKEEALAYEGRLASQAKEIEELKAQIEREKRNVKENEEIWKQRIEEWNKSKQQEVRSIVTSHANKYEKLQMETKSLKEKLAKCEKKLEELGVDPETLQGFQGPKSEEELQSEIKGQKQKDAEIQRVLNAQKERTIEMMESVQQLNLELSKIPVHKDDECSPMELILQRLLSAEFDYLDEDDFVEEGLGVNELDVVKMIGEENDNIDNEDNIKIEKIIESEQIEEHGMVDSTDSLEGLEKDEYRIEEEEKEEKEEQKEEEGEETNETFGNDENNTITIQSIDESDDSQPQQPLENLSNDEVIEWAVQGEEEEDQEVLSLPEGEEEAEGEELYNEEEEYDSDKENVDPALS